MSHQAVIIEAHKDKKQYYVHYLEHDRRLDEWVSEDRFCEMPTVDNQTRDAPHSLNRRRNMKRKAENGSEEFHVHHYMGHHDHHARNDPTFLERLESEREEITKVKNVPKIQFGEWEIDAWYYSPFPEAYWNTKLYICEYTLKYMRKAKTYAEHRKTCQIRHPPGTQVYEDGAISLWEVDGRENQVYCQNLCLLSKLFLDHKTLYYEVTPFIFYALTEYHQDPDSPETGGHRIVGYFSKEKQSPEDYNLACILIFPPYQRCGYGKLLISCSYLLTQREKKVGSPEKPLSDLGKLSYRSYWTYVLLQTLLDYKGVGSVSDISNMTGIKVEDVISTLQALDMVRHWKGQHIIYVAQAGLKRRFESLRPPRLADPSKLNWTPPVTTNGPLSSP